MSDLRSMDLFRCGALTRFRAANRTRFVLNCEALETRQLLSTTPAAASNPSQIVVQNNLQVLPFAQSGSTAYTPQQIQSAYGVNQIAFSGGKVAGNGAGQTIAIVTAYNDPNIQSDLATFDSQNGLPAASLSVDNLGATTTDPGWALETSLDVEWAHSIAPGANIILVEAPSDSLNALFGAVNAARYLPTVSVVSMSWGTPEFFGESAYDSLFTTPAGHIGETFVAASGDSGAWSGPMYPSVSPNVLAVGGTTLTPSPSGSYGSETGWTYSTGGFSGLDSDWWTYESEPSYQTATLQSAGLSYGVRTTPDVSFNANPATGVAVYDSVPYDGASGWYQVGGTSAATPAWAALIAIADQGLVAGGKGTLSNTQALTNLYSLPSSDFHEITTGFNGYYATTGYNLVTGLGSPNANLVIAGILKANGVSEAAVATQATALTTSTSTSSSTSTTATTHQGRSGSHFDDGSSSTSTSSTTSVLVQPTSGLAGTAAASGTFGIQAQVTQNGSTQAPPLAQQTTAATVTTQSTATPPALGQSLPQASQSTSSVQSAGETTLAEPSLENATPLPSPPTMPEAAPAPEQNTVPAPEQNTVPAPEQSTVPNPDQNTAPAPGQMPSGEALVVAPAPVSDELVEDPALSLRDAALGQLGLSSLASRRSEVPSRSASDPEQVTEPLSERGLATLAGAAVVTVGGYRVLIGRSDHIKRRRTPGWFR